MCFKIQNTWLRLFIWALSRPNQKQRMIVMGANVPPYFKKVNHFFHRV